MPPPPGWTLTPQAFERLLGRLAPDRDAAALEYDAIRRKLVLFFTMRGSAGAENLADDTMDRVARRLDEGESIEHVRSYCAGVARRVLFEEARRQARERAFVDNAHASPVAEDDAGRLAERREDCLRRCLQALPPESRALIVDYYRGEGTTYLKERKRLAEHLGITYIALKTRAHRLRTRLEDCLRRCVSGPEAVTDGPRLPQP